MPVGPEAAFVCPGCIGVGKFWWEGRRGGGSGAKGRFGGGGCGCIAAGGGVGVGMVEGDFLFPRDGSGDGMVVVWVWVGGGEGDGEVCWGSGDLGGFGLNCEFGFAWVGRVCMCRFGLCGRGAGGGDGGSLIDGGGWWGNAGMFVSSSQLRPIAGRSSW